MRIMKKMRKLICKIKVLTKHIPKNLTKTTASIAINNKAYPKRMLLLKLNLKNQIL